MFQILPLLGRASLLVSIACLVPLAADAKPAQSLAAMHQQNAVIQALLDAGLARDFDRYLTVLLPTERESHSQVEHRRRFDWTRFHPRAHWYVRDKQPTRFVVVRRETTGKDQRKVFLKDLHNQRRMPVPVHIWKHKGQWYVKTHSL